MFSGESVHPMDGKGRVHVPKRFLEQLRRDEAGGQAVYLTRGMEGCLFLFSEESFQRALEGLETHAFVSPETRTFQRLFFSKAQRLPVDRAGRVLVPENLRRCIGLEGSFEGKELVMVGVVDRAEIWRREQWERFEAENEEKFQLLDQVLSTRKESRPE